MGVFTNRGVCLTDTKTEEWLKVVAVYFLWTVASNTDGILAPCLSCCRRWFRRWQTADASRSHSVLAVAHTSWAACSACPAAAASCYTHSASLNFSTDAANVQSRAPLQQTFYVFILISAVVQFILQSDLHFASIPSLILDRRRTRRTSNLHRDPRSTSFFSDKYKIAAYFVFWVKQ